MNAVILLLTTLSSPLLVSASGRAPGPGQLEIIYAVNCGGDSHRDVYGIEYLKDPSTDGVASDHGKRLNIQRVQDPDQILYQTERYSSSSFGYDLPVKGDGDYVLVLKFSEVYFRNNGGKVFNVILNNRHAILTDLDIHANVGYATAHDEIIPYRVSNSGKRITIGDQSSDIQRSRIRLDFVRGKADNPKINAFYLVKGDVRDVPRLSELEQEEEPYDDDEDDEMLYGDDEEDIQFRKSDIGRDAGKVTVFRRPKPNIRSGSPAEDPWENENIFVVYAPVGAALLAGTVGLWAIKKIY